MSARIKYPRTPHLPWSESVTSDDRTLRNVDHLVGKRVVITEKMDGENTTLYSDHIHARSLDSNDHWSRHWVKGTWSQIRRDIPDGWRVCGENMYATHSILYENLPSYFLAFSVWKDEDVCLSWNETEDSCEILGIPTVPVLWRGEFQESMFPEFWGDFDPEKTEGYVIRVEDSFRLEEFSQSIAKFVRKGHVQTDDHWMHSGTRKKNSLGG